MSAPAKSSFFQHYARYAAGNFAVMVAGFVSLPVTARWLTVHDFGVLAYWDTWALVAAGVLKLGMGDAMLRFRPHDADEATMRRYETSLVAVPALLALLGWMVAMVGLGVAVFFGRLPEGVAALFAIGQVIITVWASHVLWFLQAQERSGINSLVSAGSRWLTVLLTVLILTTWLAEAEGVFIARLVSGLCVIGFLWVHFARHLRVRRADFDPVLFREGFAYGLPLALKEVSSVALAFADRILIKAITGDFAVLGAYSLGYGLATYIEQALGTALGQAFTPAANRLFVTEGAAAVRALKTRILDVLVYLWAAGVAGLLLAGPDLVFLLAGRDKVVAAQVFGWAGLLFISLPLASVMNTGLLLHRRSRDFFLISVAAAGLGVALHLVFIPRWGAMGALLSGAVAQAVLQVALYVACPADLRAWPTGRRLMTALLTGGLVWLAGHWLMPAHEAHAVWRVLTAAALVLPTFALVAWWREPAVRAPVIARWRRLRGA